MLVLRKPWTRQPQRPARPSQKWLDRGLIFLQVPAAAGVNLVSGRRATTAAPSGGGTGRHGRTFEFNGATNGFQHANTQLDFSSVGGCAALVLFKPNTTTAGILFSHNDGSTVPISLGTDYTASTLRVASYRTQTAADSYIAANTTTLAVGSEYLLTWSFADDTVGGAATVYINGVAQGITTLSAIGTQSTQIGAPTTEVSVGAYSGGASGRLNGSIYLIAGFNRNLSVAEHLSLQANPWQLFEESRAYVPTYSSIVTGSIAPSRIESTVAFGTSTVVRTAVAAAAPARIESTVAFGAATVAGSVWTGYEVINVANTGAAVTNFQQVLQLTSADVDFSLWQADGDDIRITTADGTTVLPHWKRVWDATNEIGEIWFKANSLGSSGTTTFRLYYGNAGVSSTSSYDGVFQKLDDDGATALALYHFDESSGSPVDETGNTTCTLVGSPSRVGSDIGGWGPLPTQNFSTGNALALNGSSQYATIGSVLDTMPSEYSIEFVFTWLTAPTTSDHRLLTKYQSDPTWYGIDLFYNGTTKKLVFRTNSSSGLYVDLSSLTGIGSSFNFSANVPYRILIQQSTTHGKELWINAALEGKAASQTIVPNSGTYNPLTLGAYNDGGGVSHHAHCQIDELRVLPRWQTRNEIVANAQRRKWFSGVSSQADRLTRSGGNPLLVAAGGSAWDADMAQEPVVVDESGTKSILYCGYKSGAYAGIGLATASTLDGTYTKNASNPVLRGVSSHAAHAGIWKESSTYHLFYADTIAATANLRRSTSTDLETWSGDTVAIANNADAAIISWANPKVVKIASTYHMLVEGRTADGTKWVVCHATNTAIDNDGGWTFSANVPLTTLEYFPGKSYSHLSPVLVGNKWHAWYHSNTTAARLPSVIVHAVSADLEYWLPDIAGGIVLDHCNDGATVGGQEVDQIADPTMLESGGSSYLFYDVSGNTSGTTAKIGVATYAGALSAFVADNPSASIAVEAAVTATRIASTLAFGTATVARTAVASVAAARIESTATFGTATVTRTGVAAVTPSRIESTVTFGTATVARTAVATLAPSRIASTAAFGTHVIAANGLAAIAPARIESTATFGTATVARAAVASITPGRIDSAATFGVPTVTSSTPQITVARIASTVAFGTATVVRTGEDLTVYTALGRQRIGRAILLGGTPRIGTTRL